MTSFHRSAHLRRGAVGSLADYVELLVHDSPHVFSLKVLEREECEVRQHSIAPLAIHKSPQNIRITSFFRGSLFRGSPPTSIFLLKTPSIHALTHSRTEALMVCNHHTQHVLMHKERPKVGGIFVPPSVTS